MTMLATVEDYFTHTGQDPALLQDHDAVLRAIYALEAASAQVRAYCGRDFDVVTQTLTMDGSGTDSLVLPVYPIVEVVSVNLRDDEDVETLVEYADYRVYATAGILRRLSTTWPRGRLNVVVEVTAGYVNPNDEAGSGDVLLLPKDLRDVVVSIASRVVTVGASVGTGEVESVTIGSFSETYATTGETGSLGLEPTERTTLEKYRKLGVA